MLNQIIIKKTSEAIAKLLALCMLLGIVLYVMVHTYDKFFNGNEHPTALTQTNMGDTTSLGLIYTIALTILLFLVFMITNRISFLSGKKYLVGIIASFALIFTFKMTVGMYYSNYIPTEAIVVSLFSLLITRAFFINTSKKLDLE